VQTESAVKDYFANTAAAWEGITYMKSRAIGGDAQRAELFLHQLQEVDWRRYGQSGRSRTDLRQMRLRLEKEQGASHPLKAARIEVLESMGHLDRSEAQFLIEAATFYRALDHGLRVLSGHAEGKLPSAEAQVETLSALLSRWTPIPLADLGEIRTRTRELFDRLFS
jgi:glutamate-ammonia-ligase adenylyltransferase